MICLTFFLLFFSSNGIMRHILATFLFSSHIFCQLLPVKMSILLLVIVIPCLLRWTWELRAISVSIFFSHICLIRNKKGKIIKKHCHFLLFPYLIKNNYEWIFHSIVIKNDWFFIFFYKTNKYFLSSLFFQANQGLSTAHIKWYPGPLIVSAYKLKQVVQPYLKLSSSS